jgi:DNA-binding NtrC family response regulator
MQCILVLEDYAPLRRVQAATLQRAGWRVVQAKSAREALQQLRRQHFDVVLLDMDVATGESWRVLQSLQTAHQRVPVVALLSSGSQRTAELQATSSCVVLAKPVGRQALLAGVDQALNIS